MSMTRTELELRIKELLISEQQLIARIAELQELPIEPEPMRPVGPYPQPVNPEQVFVDEHERLHRIFCAQRNRYTTE